MDVEEVSGEALNKLFSEGFSQFFNFQNLLSDVRGESGLFIFSRLLYVLVCLDMFWLGTNVYILVSHL